MADFLLAALVMGAAVFAASAAAKLRRRVAYREFRSGLRATRLVPDRLAGRAALAVAVAETACATGLLTVAGLVGAAAGQSMSTGVYWLAATMLTASAALTAALGAGIAVVIRRGITVRCPCFGTAAARPLGLAHLARNICLLALLLAGLACDLPGHGSPEQPGSVLAVSSGLIVALLFIRWDDLASLLTPVPRTPHDRQGPHADAARTPR